MNSSLNLAPFFREVIPHGELQHFCRNGSLTTNYDTLFGTNANYSDNDTNSGIKNRIENNFYTTYLGNPYDDKLEGSAGYCNDRSLGAANVNNWTTIKALFCYFKSSMRPEAESRLMVSKTKTPVGSLPLTGFLVFGQNIVV